MADRRVVFKDGQVWIFDAAKRRFNRTIPATPDIDSLPVQSLIEQIDDALRTILNRDDISPETMELLARAVESTREIDARINGNRS